VLVFPIVVIAAGGDLELVWQEFKAFARVPLVVTVYAQGPSPSTTVGPSPGVTVGPSPGVTPVFPEPAMPTPLLTRWGYMSASIVLALIALWSFMGRRRGTRSKTSG